MWIDILSLDTYKKFGRFGFNYILAELFPRKLKPVYPPHASTEEKAYITWQTAEEDIHQQRHRGVHGPKYLILCHLYNENKGKYVNKTVYWDMHYGLFKDQKISNESKVVQLPQIPCWKYKIRNVKKVTYKNIKYIESHEEEIINGMNEPCFTVEITKNNLETLYLESLEERMRRYPEPDPLIPPRPRCFLGYDYTEFYYSQITEANLLVENLLQTFSFETHYLIYHCF